ncbi:trace amine-associated receptor 13c-like [Chanos chanos]|uniref:Trace amine-associated receptor 13c-like n=1 Tax=Chanos chanos TaxID=29144 RepID=A0A6J2WKM7_CHACN|nr:trace amine-associated receptor 13c-like [Chanos chanos]
MEPEELEAYHTVQYCFPSHNSSCTKQVRSTSEYIVLYVFFSSISVSTVFLNLLVILSISHFKQLHTPTNLLVLSLAVADLMVGGIVMPMESIRLIESCWYFGERFCAAYPLIVYIAMSASLGNLVFISVDRYIAVSDPLRYTTRVTIRKTLFCIIICWICSLIYAVVLLFDHFSNPTLHVACYGNCVVITEFTWGIVDLMFTSVGPCTVIIVLYVNVFSIARKQVKVINAMNTSIKENEKVALPKRSERKAAKTLGIVVVVYLLCWIPYYISILTVETITTSSITMTIFTWLIYINSCMNPVIYALFYPWFKTSVKHIMTLKILQSSSPYMDLSQDN